jgi:GxxExxY protein
LAAEVIFNTKARKAEKHERPSGDMGRRFEELSAEVIGAALSVHKELGPGFLESIYHAAMRVSLGHRGVPFDSELLVSIGFEGAMVGQARIDLIVGNQIVVELKAVREFREIHFAQLKSYLHATNLRVGLLFNFNSPTLHIRRMVLD